MCFSRRLFMVAVMSLVVAGLFEITTPASACSRVLYTATNRKLILVGRNMERLEDLRSNMWVMPRGVKCNGMATKNSALWTVKYGRVTVSGCDVASTDGRYDTGLVTNLLRRAESDSIAMPRRELRTTKAIALNSASEDFMRLYVFEILGASQLAFVRL